MYSYNRFPKKYSDDISIYNHSDLSSGEVYEPSEELDSDDSRFHISQSKHILNR